MTDPYAGNASSLVSPAQGAFDVTPSDIADLPQLSRALYVGTGGTLTVEMAWGGTTTFRNLPNGALLPIRARKVLAATTAAFIVGLY